MLDVQVRRQSQTGLRIPCRCISNKRNNFRTRLSSVLNIRGRTAESPLPALRAAIVSALGLGPEQAEDYMRTATYENLLDGLIRMYVYYASRAT